MKRVGSDKGGYWQIIEEKNKTMSNEYSEDNLVEAATQDALTDLGWQVKTALTKETFGDDGLLGREDKSEVIFS